MPSHVHLKNRWATHARFLAHIGVAGQVASSVEPTVVPDASCALAKDLTCFGTPPAPYIPCMPTCVPRRVYMRGMALDDGVDVILAWMYEVLADSEFPCNECCTTGLGISGESCWDDAYTIGYRPARTICIWHRT